jgi:hypothetical protein
VGEDAAWFEERWSHLTGGGAAASDWVVVWKFPGDLNRIPTFRAIDVPLPVGSYPFLDDRWWVPSPAPAEVPSLPLNCVVEKMRTDIPRDYIVSKDGSSAGGGHVHHLERVGGGDAQVAAITSGYYIDGYWEGQPKTLPQIIAMLKELYDLGVYAVPCYGQHHVIVLYSDLTTAPSGDDRGTLLTPQVFCDRILATERGAAVLAALQRGAYPEKRAAVARWSEDMMRVYG